MKAITIRGVEPEVAQKLKQTATNQGKSVNQLVLEILKKNLGFEKDKKYSKKYSDLDHLFGKWSAEEFKRISGKINQERQIDREFWE
jgi:plasmid stability protein